MIHIRPLNGTFGAELRGIDISQPLSNDQIAAIRNALLDYKVLFLSDQPEISMERQVAFGRSFGPLETEYPSFSPQQDSFPEVCVFDGAVSSGRASIWHIDLSISQTPSMGGILYMKELPDPELSSPRAATTSIFPAFRVPSIPWSVCTRKPDANACSSVRSSLPTSSD
jgi:taurine dioxygenase